MEARFLLAADVLTYHNDLASTGQNQAETVLNTTNVNSAQFGKRFSTPVRGQIYGQPLYESAVNITFGTQSGLHNVVFVATERDFVYAIDASTGSVLWSDHLLNPAAGESAVPAGDMSENLVTPVVGITGTPVIDPSTNTLYVAAKTKRIVNGVSLYIDRLHAIDLGSGADRSVVIGKTLFDGTNYTSIRGPAVHGAGDGNVNGWLSFNDLREMNRTAMSLVNGVVYLSFASPNDVAPYHGWVLGYNAQTLQLSAAFNTTPNGSAGGIWESGGRLSSDAQGNLYVTTGNGTFDTTLDAQGFPISGDFGDSVLKLSPDPASSQTNQTPNGWGLKVVDYFTPFNQAQLSASDTDLGSGDVLLLPPSAGSGAHPDLLLTAGKNGTIYLIDRNAMGHFDPNGDHVVQEVPGLLASVFGSTAFFNNTVYIAGTGSDPLLSLPISNATILTAAIGRTPDSFGFSSTPVISANGRGGAVLWALSRTSSELRAYQARNVAAELYTSDQAAGGRDQIINVTKFSVPTVADGMVFVGTENGLIAFGLL